MEKQSLEAGVLPLNKEENICALVLGTRLGMQAMLGGGYEHLQRHIDAAEWALKPEVKCLFGDETASVFPGEDAAGETMAEAAEPLLFMRWQKKCDGWLLLPCEEGEHNGEHLKEAVIACAVHEKRPAAYLRWLIENNAFCSTMADCAERLVEGDEEAFPELSAGDGLRFVKDLAPYRKRRQRMLGGAGAVIASAAFLCGVDSIGESMRDEVIRTFLAQILTEEIMPCISDDRQEGLAYAARVCTYLENACGQVKWPEMGESLIARYMASVIPTINEYVHANGTLPLRLCMALSALIMLYAGVRRNDDGKFTLPAEAGDADISDDETALQAFSYMSCDMPPESLAYAALSDHEIWGCDLREIDGIEDAVTADLRDMQLLGARAALQEVTK